MKIQRQEAFLASQGREEEALMGLSLPFACPLCGRKTERHFSELREGAILECPFCRLKLNLHGCMWEDVQKEMRKLEGKERG